MDVQKRRWWYPWKKEKAVYIGYSVPESFYGLNFFFTFAVLKVMRNRNKRILCNGKE